MARFIYCDAQTGEWFETNENLIRDVQEKVKHKVRPEELIRYEDLVELLARSIPEKGNQREAFIGCMLDSMELGDTEMPGVVDWYTSGPDEKGHYSVTFCWTPMDRD